MKTRDKLWRGLPLFVLTLLASLAGCDGDKKSPDKFVGSWTFDAGSALTADCGTALPPMTISLAGRTFTLAKGTSSDLVFTQDTCVVTFSVDGSTATAAPGQSCIFLAGTTNVTVTFDSWTLDTADGKSLSTSVRGTAVICGVTGSGTATKAEGGDAGTGG